MICADIRALLYDSGCVIGRSRSCLSPTYCPGARALRPQLQRHCRHLPLLADAASFAALLDSLHGPPPAQLSSLLCLQHSSFHGSDGTPVGRTSGCLRRANVFVANPCAT